MLAILNILKNWRAWWRAAVVAVIVGLVCFGLGTWYGYGKGKEAQRLQSLDAAVKERLELEGQYLDKALALEADLEKQRAANRTLNQRLKNETARNSVYHTCLVPPDGVRILRDAVTRSPASGKPNG